MEEQQQKPKRSYKKTETTVRVSRTLTFQELPKEVIEILNYHRELQETWKDCLIRITIENHKRRNQR